MLQKDAAISAARPLYTTSGESIRYFPPSKRAVPISDSTRGRGSRLFHARSASEPTTRLSNAAARGSPQAVLDQDKAPAVPNTPNQAAMQRGHFGRSAT